MARCHNKLTRTYVPSGGWIHRCPSFSLRVQTKNAEIFATFDADPIETEAPRLLWNARMHAHTPMHDTIVGGGILTLVQTKTLIRTLSWNEGTIRSYETGKAVRRTHGDDYIKVLFEGWL